tara:strand:+ start:537 stop:1169 length:633 start_codon:yes stop_codon:yes gene_type:complete
MSNHLLNAASIEDSCQITNINSDKSKRSKTIKNRKTKSNNNHLDDIMNKVYGSNDDTDDTGDTLGNFQPLPPPEVNTNHDTTSEQPFPVKPNIQNDNQNENLNDNQNNNQLPQPSICKDDACPVGSFQDLTSNQINDYYAKTVPMYQQGSLQTAQKDLLMEKLNYMIHLLEEQHNENTGHVTEEVILYSFLGVFIIFVLDSFARVGKYVR